MIDDVVQSTNQSICVEPRSQTHINKESYVSVSLLAPLIASGMGKVLLTLCTMIMSQLQHTQGGTDDLPMLELSHHHSLLLM